MRNFERGEIHLRARSEVHDELVAIAELDQPGAVGLRPAHEWPAGAERDDAHLVGGERLACSENNGRVELLMGSENSECPTHTYNAIS